MRATRSLGALDIGALRENVVDQNYRRAASSAEALPSVLAGLLDVIQHHNLNGCLGRLHL